jgi:hypothetical protein
MSTQEFKTVLNAQPFRPFVACLADGRQIRVHHREFAMLSPTGRTVVIYQPDGEMDIVDLLLVTDLNIGANGSRRHRRS